jgi:acyl-coenzyme A synthetase/AMP-(fatty) acid ligase
MGTAMITRAIFDWAERAPEKVALVHNGATWSYRTFAAAIAAARGFLARQGCVGPGVAVQALSDMREFWVLNLALRSLGLMTVAVRSAEEIGELRLPDVRFVVASAAEGAWPGLAERCAGPRPLLVSASWEGEAPLGIDAPPELPPGGHILQTSGTTGSPKKVLIDPAFELAFSRRRQGINAVTQESVVAVFDFGAWTSAGYQAPVSVWFAGATTVIEQEQRWRALLYPGITHATLVPHMIDAILAAPRGSFPRSATMVLGIVGGAATRAQIEQIKARITPHVVSRIGTTEAGSYTYTPLETEEDLRWHLPLPGRMQLVDAQDRPVPVGTSGRVRIATTDGPTGYLYDREATREFFKDGFFYPGDLAVMRADGRIALQGRVTGVININGQKTSPEPIEERLSDELGVTGVCLVSMPDESGAEQIHVVIEAPQPILAERLSAVLSRALKGFPAARIYYAATLPRNAMGKLQRDRVRELIVATGAG